MSHRNVFVTGPISGSDIGSSLQPYSIDRILTAFGRPLFGHPVIESAKTANVPVACSSWATDPSNRRDGDLVLDSHQPVEQLAQRHGVLALQDVDGRLLERLVLAANADGRSARVVVPVVRRLRF